MYLPWVAPRTSFHDQRVCQQLLGYAEEVRALCEDEEDEEDDHADQWDVVLQLT